eukprot:12893465-Prorocentrum_lima.AAC.1
MSDDVAPWKSVVARSSSYSGGERKCALACVQSLTHVLSESAGWPFIHSFIRSYVHSFVRSFIPSCIQSVTESVSQSQVFAQARHWHAPARSLTKSHSYVHTYI